VLIPIAGDLVNRSRKIWKGLRDVRDRSARHDNRWRDMAIGGLVEQERAMVIVQHAGIDLDEVWGVLERRWPQAVLTDVGGIEPSFRLIADDVAGLALPRRDIEPLWIAVKPMIAAMTPAGCKEPSPVLF
jgi:hypothetical protein